MLQKNLPDILFVSKPLSPPWNDGTKVLIRNLISGLNRFSYLIFTSESYKIDKSNFINIPLATRGKGEQLIYKAKLLSYISMKRRAAIYCYFFAPTPTTVYIARAVNRIRGVPSVQVIPSQPLSWRHKDELIFGDKIVVLSRYTYEKVISLGVEKDRVTIIPPSVCPTFEENLERRAVELRKRLSIEPEQYVILYPGDLEFSGAIWNILETAKKVVKEFNTVFIIASRPKTEVALNIEKIVHREVEASGISNKFRFVGEVPDIKALIKLSDLCIFPVETTYAKIDYPLVVLEAMELGIPIVVGKGTPLEELAVEYGTGFAVNPYSSDELKEAIIALLANGELRKNLGMKARSTIRENFLPEHIGGLYEKVFEELLHSL